jgi:hypothetical protein
MWDLWWDKVAQGQVFSEYFGFPCSRRSLHQLLHNHPHVSSGECTIGQCSRSAGTYRDLGDLKQRDLKNLNLGDLKKGPNGGLSPTPQINIPGGEGRPARKADNLTAICDPIVYKMWEPQHLTALWVSTARYSDTFTFFIFLSSTITFFS